MGLKRDPKHVDLVLQLKLDVMQHKGTLTCKENGN